MPCREGGTWLERILTRIVDGHGAPEDLDLLFEVGESICPGAFPHAASERLGLEAVPFPYKMTTICFVGPSAYAPIHSALTLFRDEFEAKIKPRTRIPVTASAHDASRAPASPAEREAAGAARRGGETPAPPSRRRRRRRAAAEPEPDPNAVADHDQRPRRSRPARAS